jgi:hypothetical protein
MMDDCNVRLAAIDVIGSKMADPKYADLPGIVRYVYKYFISFTVYTAM